MQLLARTDGRRAPCSRHERGHAVFTGPHTVRIQRARARTRACTRITSSSPPVADHAPCPDIPVDEQHILTSDGIFNIEELPKSIVIIGAGVIGCEFATIFCNLGAHTRAPHRPRGPHPALRGRRRVRTRRTQPGTTWCDRSIVPRSSNASQVGAARRSGIRHSPTPTVGTEIVRVEKALLSVGRIPNVEGLGLEQRWAGCTTRSPVLIR